jgi:hypothetical protein
MGKMQRFRLCNSPSPKCGGIKCPSENGEVISIMVNETSIDEEIETTTCNQQCMYALSYLKNI